MVEFVDGSVKAQLGIPDMKLPIQYALTYPERPPSAFKRVDFAALGRLTFQDPDTDRFPCLALAFRAMREGGTAPAVLNAANEAAVAPEVGDTECPVWTLRSKDDDGRHGEAGVSVLRAGGTDRLIGRLREYLGGMVGQAGDAVVTRARHREALGKCAELLRRAAAEEKAGEEIRAEWLREAADWIGRLTGRIDVEEVLGAIFSEFCIGK